MFFWILSKLPPLPQFGQLVQLFSDVEIEDLKVSWGLKILYIHYNILYIYNLKIQFKLLSFWRKKTPIIDQQCTYEKVPEKNLGRALPPPSDLDKIQKNSSFFSGSRPLHAPESDVEKNDQFLQSFINMFYYIATFEAIGSSFVFSGSVSSYLLRKLRGWMYRLRGRAGWILYEWWPEGRKGSRPKQEPLHGDLG